MSLPNRSLTSQTYDQLRQRLSELLPIVQEAIRRTERFEALIPAEDRRRIWKNLREAGFALPELTLSSRFFLAVAVIVVAPLALLGYFFGWSYLISLPELGLLARKITRPMAICPPIGCQTLQEAALQLTPFRKQDYHAGLWPREDIAGKIRLVISEATNLPFETIKEERRLSELLD